MSVFINKTHYKAFTLIEMLIVLGIFVILTSMTVASFNGFREAILLNETSLNVQQDIRYAQRAAMFLKKDPEEKWLYGIGIDFRQTESNGTYKMFKWCTPYLDYGNARTKSEFPNYDDSAALSTINGNIPIGSYTVGDNGLCNKNNSGTPSSGVLREILSLGPKSVEKPLKFRTLGDASGDAAGKVAFILFESVSGRAFFYDAQGLLVNYRYGGSSNGQVVNSPVPFTIEIEAPNNKKVRVLKITNVAGKISSDTRDI